MDMDFSDSDIDSAISSFDSKEREDVQNRNALIIDDDQWIHRVLQHMLRQLGFEPLSATDPVEGLAMAINDKPMVLLLDIVMPDIKGDVVLKLLRQIEKLQDLSVIVISGNLSADIVGKAYKDGANALLSKPVTKDTLYEKLVEALGQTVMDEVSGQTDSAPTKKSDSDDSGGSDEEFVFEF